MARPAAEFEEAFAQRLLVSEGRRARLMAWLFSGLVVLAAGFNLLYRQLGAHLAAMDGVLLSFVLAAGYEWLAWGMFRRLAARRQQPPPWRFYANALVEASLPTLTLVVLLNFLPPMIVFTSPVTYLYFLIIMLAALRLDFRLCLFSGLVAAAGYAGLVIWKLPEIFAFSNPAILQMRVNLGMRAVLFVAAGGMAGLVSRVIYANLRETMRGLEERQRIVNLFGQHVSPQVVNQLLTQPREAASAQREVCVLVLDIRKFTTYSEDHAADEVVAYLNTLWGALVRIVNAHQGVVNKFLGDGFLAVFGVPIESENYCEKAAAAAREILAEVRRLEADGKIPPTRVGLALHAGPAIVGNIGSEERKEYTVIGDVVNVAFRIEALNKDLGSRLLVSAPVRERAGLAEGERMEPMPIRGRREPVELFRLA
ncbi:MAG TPA: adenylate/guanylate cyclase domain-containing protein [Chthoniobacterales bacterium]